MNKTRSHFWLFNLTFAKKKSFLLCKVIKQSLTLEFNWNFEVEDSLKTMFFLKTKTGKEISRNILTILSLTSHCWKKSIFHINLFRLSFQRNFGNHVHLGLIFALWQFDSAFSVISLGMQKHVKMKVNQKIMVKTIWILSLRNS